MTAVAYLALGSNQDNPEFQLARAIGSLSRAGTVSAVSPVYRTSPVGFAGQPDFLNCVAELKTPMGPEDLLAVLKQIEREAGRTEGGPRNGPRPIDIDILFLEGAHVSDRHLTLPHPRIAERGFVLYPLADLNPGLVLSPGGLPVGELLARWRRENRTDRVERAEFSAVRADCACPTS